MLLVGLVLHVLRVWCVVVFVLMGMCLSSERNVSMYDIGYLLSIGAEKLLEKLWEEQMEVRNDV